MYKLGGSRWRQWSHKILWVILILISIAVCHSSPVYLKNSHHLSHYQSGRNIRHLPCKIRRSGEEGICMFAIDCLKSNGTHLGTCIDRFYFGSCCHMKEDPLLVESEISDNSIDENTISHFLHQQIHSTSSTVRPSLEDELPERTERPLVPVSTISATTSHILSSESSVPALHHHYTTNYDVISVSSSSSMPSTSSKTSPVPSSTSSTPLDETRFTSSIPLPTTTPENVKLSTFQSVDGVTKAPAEEATTTATSTTTHSTRYPTRRTTTQEPTTSSTTTVKSTTFSPKPKPKPTNVKRPVSTKKPTIASTTSRPKPTRRPTTSAANVTAVTKKPSRKPPTEATTLTPVVPTRKKTTTALPKTTVAPKTTTSTTTTPVSTPVPVTTTTSTSTTTPASTTTTTTEKPSKTTTTEKPSSTTTIKITEKTTEPSTTKPTMVTKQPQGTDEEEKPLTTLSFIETTKAPRPKPKPTSSIVIVPPTTIAAEIQDSTVEVQSPVITLNVTTTSTVVASIANATTVETTTMSSGLVTWINLDESEKNKTSSTTEGWIPLQTIPVDSTSEAAIVNATEPVNTTTTEGISSSTEATKGNVTEVTSTQTTGGDLGQNSTMETSTTMPSLEGIDYKQICGKRMFPEPRIVGGTKASFGRWPWQISLRQWRTSTYLHKCGAALLNENWAITAAHCVDNVPPSDLLLRLGEYDLAEEEEPYGYQERRVQIVASHPQFDPRTFEYDLALLRFYEPVIFQPNIIPVCVPDSDENFIGRTAYVTGWGRLYEDGPLPSVLQEVTVPVIENSICEAMYRRAGYIEHIPHIFICAGWKNGGFDSCEGDSGGPMVIQRHDKRFQLAGVISWGIGCAEPNQPGVYTRISEFRDWINQILQF